MKIMRKLCFLTFTMLTMLSFSFNVFGMEEKKSLEETKKPLVFTVEDWDVLDASQAVEKEQETYSDILASENYLYKEKAEKMYSKWSSDSSEVKLEKLKISNKNRFQIAVGNGTSYRRPTQEELNIVAESLWQHAGCLLEDETIYDYKTNLFKEEGLKKEFDNLLNISNRHNQSNVSSLLSGLCYTLGLATGKDGKRDIWNLASSSKSFGFSGSLRKSIDTYFSRDKVSKEKSIYENNSSTYQNIEENRIGHWTILMNPSLVKQRKKSSPVFLISRNAVTKGDPISIQKESFLYVGIQGVTNAKPSQSFPLLRPLVFNNINTRLSSSLKSKGALLIQSKPWWVTRKNITYDSYKKTKGTLRHDDAYKFYYDSDDAELNKYTQNFPFITGFFDPDRPSSGILWSSLAAYARDPESSKWNYITEHSDNPVFKE